MKTAISIPDAVFSEAERLAQDLRMSRSELYTRAVEQYVGEHAHSYVREKLDAVYSDEASTLDSALLDAQAKSVGKDSW